MTASSSTPSLLDALTDTPRLSPPSWRRIGWLRRYLITARAAVLPLTLFCCLFGGLLALPWTPDEGWRLFLSTLALVLAHATSNLLNDLVDWMLGVDRDGYFRVRYGAHPLAQSLMHPLTHALLLLITAGAALFAGLIVCTIAGPPAWWLAAIGTLLLAFYTWPLKRLGLGELAVFLVWGPLMVGGVYWVVSGDWGPEIAMLSALFGLGPTLVVLGKHTDKRGDDAARGIRTLPVILGPVWSPRLMVVVAAGQVAGGLVWAWSTGSWAYAVLLAALPATWRLVWVCLRKRPTARPKGYPAHVWPLWYTAVGFRFARATGAALALGALLDGL